MFEAVPKKAKDPTQSPALTGLAYCDRLFWDRKNFLFHDTVKGATASAIVYTLAETAKVDRLNICLYLETVMTKMLDYKNESQSIIEDLMSWSKMIQETCNLNKHSEIRFTMDWMRRIFIRQFMQRLLKKSKTFVSDFISPSIYL